MMEQGLREQVMGLPASERKELFAELWDSLTDSDEISADLSRLADVREAAAHRDPGVGEPADAVIERLRSTYVR